MDNAKSAQIVTTLIVHGNAQMYLHYAVLTILIAETVHHVTQGMHLKKVSVFVSHKE